jgi:hypothetical protein
MKQNPNNERESNDVESLKMMIRMLYFTYRPKCLSLNLISNLHLIPTVRPRLDIGIIMCEKKNFYTFQVMLLAQDKIDEYHSIDTLLKAVPRTP